MQQVDCVAMGSPLVPSFASIFMCSFKSKWLRDCSNSFKPVFYRGYVNEIFQIFSSFDHADRFKEYFSSKHRNINFSIEKKKDGCITFLDVSFYRGNENFAINI